MPRAGPTAAGGVDLLRQRQPALRAGATCRRHAVVRADLPRLRRAEPRRRRQPDRSRGAGRPAARRLLPLGAGRPAGGVSARSPKAPSAAASRRAASPARRRACRASTARATASTTTPAGSPATPSMAGDYFGYDGPFPPFNDSLIHHYVFTLYALRRRALPRRGRVRRRRRAPRDPRPRARRGDALGHLHAEPAAARLSAARRPTPQPTRASSPSATARPPGTSRLRMQGQLDIAAQRRRPLAGRARRRSALADETPRRDLRERPRARATRRRAPSARVAGVPVRRRRRPARALLRRLRGPDLRRGRAALARARAARWRQRDPDFAPEGAESLRALLRALRRAPRRASPPRTRARRSRSSRTAACSTACTAPRRASALQAPRTWQLGNASINRLLYTPQGFTLVGWSDTAHLEQAPLDEADEGEGRRRADRMGYAA